MHMKLSILIQNYHLLKIIKLRLLLILNNQDKKLKNNYNILKYIIIY